MVSGHIMKYVLFTLNEQEYGVPIEQVVAIEKIQHLTTHPNMDEMIRGVVAFRNLVIPLVDLRYEFKVNMDAIKEEERMIVIQKDKLYIGFLVHEARDVIEMNTSDLYDPFLIHDQQSDYIKVGKLPDRLLITIDIHLFLDQWGKMDVIADLPGIKQSKVEETIEG